MLKTLMRWLGAGLLLAALLLTLLLLKSIPERVAAIQPTPDTRFWTLPGGYRIAYRHLPRAPLQTAKAPVVFLHGGPGGYVHSSVLRLLAPLTELGHDVYLYDQSGSGRSDRRARPKDTTIASHLADLEVIRQRIGAPKLVLIGQSFGGLLAALYAAEHPERIERLVLSSPAVLQPESFDADGTSSVERLFATPAGLRFRPPADYASATGASQMPLRAIAAFTLAQLFNVKPIPDRELDAAINTLATGFTRTMVCDPGQVQPEEGGAGGYARVGTNFYPDDFVDPRPALRRLQAPVLVLQGECDFLSYANAYEYVALFPQARYHYIAGAGHIIWWDRPADYAAAVQGFLGE
jgi:pimeloyl-ACP methyl ester carboxylesterase